MGVNFDAHTLLVASVWIICGYQSVLFAILTKTFGVSVGLLPDDVRIARLRNLFRLEGGLLAGVGSMAFGLLLLLGAVGQWRAAGFGNLDYAHTMRWVIPGMTLTTVGFQTVLASFFLSVLEMRRR
jgi:hypothetical protein